jgi:hypothetical protein
LKIFLKEGASMKIVFLALLLMMLCSNAFSSPNDWRPFGFYEDGRLVMYDSSTIKYLKGGRLVLVSEMVNDPYSVAMTEGKSAVMRLLIDCKNDVFASIYVIKYKNLYLQGSIIGSDGVVDKSVEDILESMPPESLPIHRQDAIGMVRDLVCRRS